MSLDRYRMLAQIGAGSDGIAYRGQADDGTPVEIRLLSAARADAGRWIKLVRSLRLSALLKHPLAIGVRELGLDDDTPFVVMDVSEGKTLAQELHGQLPLPESRVALLGEQLADVLAAAHRLGITHGKFWPTQISFLAPLGLKIDFTGIDTRSLAGQSSVTSRDLLWTAPEQGPGGIADPAADVHCLGALLFWLLTGRTISRVPLAPAEEASPFLRLIASMLALDPALRPSAKEAASQLADLHSVPMATSEFLAQSKVVTENRTIAEGPRPRTIADTEDALNRDCLGRFRLLGMVGQGGMGRVYRAEDPTDGGTVAIKVLRADWAKRPQAVQRFHREARLLAEVNNPYVANLLEVNEDEGIHYMAMEFVEGRSLAEVLAAKGRLAEKTALSVMADVARALVDAHEHGIVHRDIKPDNILMAGVRGMGSGAGEDLAQHVKLTDFGLARHVVESESLNFTQAGTLLGTPFYMAPEQCSGQGTVDARTDIYAMGATLFHLLAGRPPFLGPNHLSIIAMHCNEPPPPLRSFAPQVSEATCQIIDKCLAKAQESRYRNAGDLLNDLERLLRGEPTRITVHPRLPQCDPSKLIQYDWVWQLDASPEQLWPHVSNTDRLNKAAGLPAVQFTTQAEPEGGVRRFGKFRKVGVLALWEEHPFEWIEARRMGVLRQYSQGPFKWMVSVVELAPRAGGGATLTHRVRIEPGGLLGRTVAAVEVGIKGYRLVDRIYNRIDAALTGKLGGQGLADAFEEPAQLSTARRRRLAQLLDRLTACGVDPAVTERIGDFLELAPAQEVARIRPLALARRLALDPEQVTAACLYGAREGLLVLLWDILCPVCRIPSEVKDTLKALRDHGRCEACHLDFELDFGNSVEMIFRAHPAIRESDLGTYCIGGPAHSPHVVAQVRVGPGERIELDLSLPEGAYRLRGPQLPFTLDFRVQPSALTSRWDIDLARGPDPELPRALKTGHQLLALTNQHSQELVARLERTAQREDALTAARASTLRLFRELFPSEILSPGQLVSVANVTLLVTELDQAGNLYQELGDARAFGLIHDHFRLLDDSIRREGGALVKTVGEGVLAAFSEPVGAVRAGLDLQAILRSKETTRDLRLRVAIHRGPAMAATLNEHLDYFGSTVNIATQLLQWARGGELILSQELAADPQVAAVLQLRELTGETVTVDLPRQPRSMVRRLVLPTALSRPPEDAGMDVHARLPAKPGLPIPMGP